LTKTLADATYGETDFYVAWTNDLTTGEANVTGTMSVTLTSDNGNEVREIARTLIKPLVSSKDAISLTAKASALPLTNAAVVVKGQINGEGGSDTQYEYQTGGTDLRFKIPDPTVGNYEFTVPAGSAKEEGTVETIKITDKATGKFVIVPVTLNVE
jgi:hypothetical protein